jgi:hypothetical protein
MPLPPLTSSRLRSKPARLAARACAVALAVAGVTSARSAGAVTVAATAGAIVTHTLPSGASFTRDPTLNPSGINYEDCIEDVSYTFPITVSDATPGTDHLYVYAGVGCDDAAQRTGAAGSTCWQAVPGELTYSTDTNLPISVKVRQILSQEYSGVTAQFVASTDESICHMQATSAARTLNMYFVLSDDNGLTEAVATAAINADLSASIEPPAFVVDIGDTKLFPKWNKVNDADITGFNVYYLPQAASVEAQLMTVCPDGGTTVTGGGSSGDDDTGEGDAGSDAGLEAGSGAEAGAGTGIAPNDVIDAGDAAGASDAGSDEAGTTGGGVTTGVTGDGGSTAGCVTTTVIDSTPQSDGNAQPFVETGYSCVSPFPLNDTQPVGASDIATTSSTTDDVDGSDDGGVTTTVSSAGSIGPISFQPQEYDPTKFEMITVSASSADATITGLIDNKAYAVAVAAVDAFGNVGALTSATGLATCQYPLGTTDFWSQYQTDGGENMGCNLSDGELPGGAGLTTFLAGAACVFFFRRRRPVS